MANIEVKNISFSYQSTGSVSRKILEDVSFSIEQNNITTLLAPNDSGKSTLLKIISGLLKANSGSIEPNDKIIFIPEEPSSFPWLNVEENIKFASPNISKDKVEELASSVGLEGYSDHLPHNNSYGFRFRISLARALAVNPRLIVIDDSFKIMDGESREECYQLIKEINEKKGITFLIGTANISEALFLSNKILLLSKNPASIVETITEGLPFNNDLNVFESPSFSELRIKIEKSLKEIHRQRMSNFTI
ncbi:MAG: ATP-binding cassette domain-containing protein [Ignavibacteriae bacterium]|nr:ATP-binding cassette domain-containing protein [Ignavibacteriota bacterium]NOG98295.1 ATP-binding cassette domain-containing protein [Ignavibacteriota bacterium]